MTHQNLVLTEKAIGRHTKRLQKELELINHDIKLSEAQNMLSRIFGLKDYHELKQALKFDNVELEKNLDLQTTKNPFKEFKKFDLNYFYDILSFLNNNKNYSLYISEFDGAFYLNKEKEILKINTHISNENIDELATELYSKNALDKLSLGSCLDCTYFFKKNQFTINISPVIKESRTSPFITIMARNIKPENFNNLNYTNNINPLSYSNGLNLILSNDVNLNETIQASITQEIISKTDPMNIVLLDTNCFFDYDLTGVKHILTRTSNNYFKSLSEAIINAKRRNADFVVTNQNNLNSLNELCNITTNGINVIATMLSISNFYELIMKVLSLNSNDFYMNLILSINNILLPVSLKNDSKEYLFMFELNFTEKDKFELIKTINIETIKNILNDIMKEKLLPQIDNLLKENSIKENDFIKIKLLHKLGIILN